MTSTQIFWFIILMAITLICILINIPWKGSGGKYHKSVKDYEEDSNHIDFTPFI